MFCNLSIICKAESNQTQAVSKSFYNSHTYLQQSVSTSCVQSVLIYSQKASQSSHSMSNSAEQKNQFENQLENQLQFSALKQLDDAHVYHSADKFSDDLAQKTSKFDSLEQFNSHKEMSVTDHIEILLLKKKICQNCSQLFSNDNLLQKHFRSKTCATDMISLSAVSESSIKKKNSSAVQDIISALNIS